MHQFTGKYTVKFEFRVPGEPTFKRWMGDFASADPKHARNLVTGQLNMLGYEVGALAVYDGEWLVLGNILPFVPGELVRLPTIH